MYKLWREISTHLGADNYNLRQLDGFCSHSIKHILQFVNNWNELIHLKYHSKIGNNYNILHSPCRFRAFDCFELRLSAFALSAYIFSARPLDEEIYCHVTHTEIVSVSFFPFFTVNLLCLLIKRVYFCNNIIDCEHMKFGISCDSLLHGLCLYLHRGGGEGGLGLYWDRCTAGQGKVFALSGLNWGRVYNFTRVCPKPGIRFRESLS